MNFLITTLTLLFPLISQAGPCPQKELTTYNSDALGNSDNQLQSKNCLRIADNKSEDYCGCASKEKFLMPTKDAQASLNQRMGKYLLEQGKVNLLNTVTDIIELSLRDPIFANKAKQSCSLDQIKDKMQCALEDKNLLFSDPQREIDTIKSLFQNEIAYRKTGLSKFSKGAFFDRDKIYSDNFQNVIDAPSCGLTEEMTQKLLYQKENSQVNKLIAITSEVLQETGESFTSWDDFEGSLMDLADEQDSEEGYEKIEKVNALLKKIKSSPFLSKSFDNPTEVQAMIKQFQSGNGVDLNISKEHASTVFKSCESTITELANTLCLKQPDIQKFIPNDFVNFKKLYQTNKSENNSIINNELNLSCQKLKNEASLPDNLNDYLSTLDKLKSRKELRALKSKNMLDDNSDLKSRARVLFRDNTHKDMKLLCEELNAEQERLATMNKEEYLSSCNNSSSMTCETGLAFIDTFPEMYEELKKSPKKEINYTAVREQEVGIPPVLATFLGKPVTQEIKQSKVTTPKPASKEKIEKFKRSQERAARYVAQASGTAPRQSDLIDIPEQTVELDNKASYQASLPSVDGSSYIAPSDQQIEDNNSLLDQYINKLVGPSKSTPSPAPKRKRVTKKKVPKKVDRIFDTIKAPPKAPAPEFTADEVADVSRPLLDTSVEDETQVAEATTEGEGQFKKQSSRDKALGDFTKGGTKAVARGPASASAKAPISISKGSQGQGFSSSFSGEGRSTPEITVDGNFDDVIEQLISGSYDEAYEFKELLDSGKPFYLTSSSNPEHKVLIKKVSTLKWKRRGKDKVRRRVTTFEIQSLGNEADKDYQKFLTGIRTSILKKKSLNKLYTKLGEEPEPSEAFQALNQL